MMCAVWSCPRIHVVSERNGQLRAAMRLPRYLLDARRCTREVLDTFAPYGKGRAGRKGAPHTGRAGVGCSESPWRAVLSLNASRRFQAIITTPETSGTDNRARFVSALYFTADQQR